jgi:uridine kinase
MNSACPIQKIVKRDGTVVDYDRERIATAILKATASKGPADPGLSQDMAAKVEASLCSTYGADHTPSVEDIQDVVETVLMECKLTDLARDYIIYRHQRAMARAARAYAFEITDNIPYKKIYEVLRWNMDHGCDSVGSLNRIIARGLFPALVAESDRRYREEVAAAGALILQRLDKIRMVIVAGPSSSGKTTTTIKVSETLAKAGVSFKAINIDHYFFDLEKHPKDEFGDYDYESPQALDLDLINRHLGELLAGRTIRTPHYDFKTGTRTLDIHEMSLAKNEILLIDSLHGLYDAMTSGIPAENEFKLYIETLGQFRGEDGNFMRWADNRLLRRMIRDRDHRNLKPIGTLTHWHYVRRSELKNIIPFIKSTDCIVNSALPYELPILKHKLNRYITAVLDRYKDDPKRLDAHIRANRVHSLLSGLKTVRDFSCVPGDSLLREFIGGSVYKY